MWIETNSVFLSAVELSKLGQFDDIHLICSVGSFENLSEEILLPERVTRISTCEIEVDAMAADITNRRTATGIYYSNSYILLKIMVK
jgi:hypothetical protein